MSASLYTLSFSSGAGECFSPYRAYKQKIWYVTIVNNKDNIMYGDGLMVIP